MTPHRQANHNSHYATFPAHGRVNVFLAACTRRLRGHSVSARGHSANGIVTRAGPQMDLVQGAANALYRALLLRDVVESISFHGGVASWRVIQDGAMRRPIPGEQQSGPKTGPKLDLKKIEMGTGKSFSATSRGSRYPAEPNNSSSSVPAAAALPPSDGCPEGAGLPVMRSVPLSQTSWCGSDRSPRYGRALQARSTMLRCVGGMSCGSNQRHGGCRCLGERFEQMFEEASRQNDCPNSGASVASFGPTKRPTSSSHNAQAALSAPHNITSRATASLPMKPSWSCLTNYGPASGLDIQMVSRHRFDGIAKPVIRGRKVQVGVHSVCSPVSDLRRACGLPHADDLPLPSAHTAERIEPSESCHAFAWHHHLLSDRSGALSPPYAGTVNAGGWRDRGFRKGADGGSPATSARIPAAANAALRNTPRGVRYSSQGSLRIGRRHLGADDRSLAALSARLVFLSSSGDGLGNHQPGSMTCGFAYTRQPASGRARDRAICPAVARSDRRAA